jgi:hypothetical protein
MNKAKPNILKKALIGSPHRRWVDVAGFTDFANAIVD